MNTIYEQPVTPYVATLLFGAAVWFFLRGGRRALAAIRAIDSNPRPTDVIGGGRQVLLAIGLSFWGWGLLAHETWLLIFGLVFLGEEMVETTVMSLAHRFGPKPASATAPTRDDGSS